MINLLTLHLTFTISILSPDGSGHNRRDRRVPDLAGLAHSSPTRPDHGVVCPGAS